MTFRTPRLFASLLSLAAGLGLASLAVGQDPAKPADKPTPSGPKKDDDLEKLLEKLEARPVAQEKAETSAPSEPKSADKPASDEPKAKDKTKERRTVRPKDQDLDDLLEKLGKSEEAPTTTGKPGGGAPTPKPEAKPADAPKPTGNVKPEEQKLDDRLAEILGRKPKKKGQQQGGEGQGQGGGDEDAGMLREAVKKMREVEQRLGEPDTGEGTRQRQDEIVKNLDQVLKQLRQQAQGKAQRKMRMVQGPPQPGQQPGEQPGSQAGQGQRGTEKPTTDHVLAGDKNPWGHLPDSLREQMANVFKEGYLPAKADLIKRYYLSVNKKSLSRGE